MLTAYKLDFSCEKWYNYCRTGVNDTKEILHSSERGTVTLVTDDSGNVYVRKTGSFNTDVFHILADVRSPYIVKITGFTDSEITMEYISGKPLSELQIPAKQLPEIVCEICDGLTTLHAAGVIHRDIKPSNIMLAEDGHIRIIDFDAARIKKSDADKDTAFIGTDGFAAPEQYGFMQTDERSDIYALGVTIKLLARENYAHSKLRPVAEKCMRFDPNKRYRSAANIKTSITLRRFRAIPIAVSIAIVAGVGISVFWVNAKPDVVPVSATETETATEANLLETITTKQTRETITEIRTSATTNKVAITTTAVTQETTTSAETTTTVAETNPALTTTAVRAPEHLPEGFPTLPDGLSDVFDSGGQLMWLTWNSISEREVNSLQQAITDTYGEPWFNESVSETIRVIINDIPYFDNRIVRWSCEIADDTEINIEMQVYDSEANDGWQLCRLNFW